jgi:hypothetical protein
MEKPNCTKIFLKIHREQIDLPHWQLSQKHEQAVRPYSLQLARELNDVRESGLGFLQK